MPKKQSKQNDVIRIPIIHSVQNLPCAVVGCDKQAQVALGTGWAADTNDAMLLTAICEDHVDQLVAAYRK